MNLVEFTSRPFCLVGVGGDAVTSEGSLGQGLLGDVPWHRRGDGDSLDGNLKHQTGKQRIKQRIKNVENVFQVGL
jgi:hypothetical protein